MSESIKQLLRECNNQDPGALIDVEDNIMDHSAADDQFERLQARINISGIKIA